MSDDLRQLLQRADASAPQPAIDASQLPARIRRTIRIRRRVRAACGLALPALVAGVLMLHPKSPAPPPVAIEPEMSDIEAQVHARTAAILEASPPARQRLVDPTDAFLVNLAAQRNQTALLLLHDANQKLSQDPLAAAATLRRAIALFPDTPAASRASRQLEQLESRSQS